MWVRLRLVAGFLLTFGLACAGSPDADVDQDGFAADVDCDDNSSAINPAAVEVCDDGLDDDCDDWVDEEDDDCSISDADGDGYLPPDDCDDDNAYVNPQATELCGNGQDDDCDELIDGADTDCD